MVSGCSQISTPFDTIDGTTDGITLDGFCDLGAFGDEQIYNDVWFTYVATCTGDLTVSTCNAVDFDSRLAVYDAGPCPIDPALVLGCNDDAAGCADFTSELTVPVVKDQSYVIRVGGFSADDSGAGLLTVTSTPAEPPKHSKRSKPC